MYFTDDRTTRFCFRLTLTLPDDLHIQTWPVFPEDVPARPQTENELPTSRISKVTVLHTDRHTDRCHQRHYNNNDGKISFREIPGWVLLLQNYFSAENLRRVNGCSSGLPRTKHIVKTRPEYNTVVSCETRRLMFAGLLARSRAAWRHRMTSRGRWKPDYTRSECVRRKWDNATRPRGGWLTNIHTRDGWPSQARDASGHRCLLAPSGCPNLPPPSVCDRCLSLYDRCQVVTIWRCDSDAPGARFDTLTAMLLWPEIGRMKRAVEGTAKRSTTKFAIGPYPRSVWPIEQLTRDPSDPYEPWPGCLMAFDCQEIKGLLTYLLTYLLIELFIDVPFNYVLARNTCPNDSCITRANIINVEQHNYGSMGRKWPTYPLVVLPFAEDASICFAAESAI